MVTPADHLVEAVLAGDPGAEPLLARIERHALSPAAIAPLAEARHPGLAGDERWQAAVAANRAKGERLGRAAVMAMAALEPLGDAVALPRSVLGPLWSSDVDILVREDSLAEAEATLAAAGLLDLNPLLAAIGRTTPGVRRFAAIDGDEVLGSVELCLRLGDLGPAAGPAIERARPADDGLRRLLPEDDLRRRAAKLAAVRAVPLRGALELLGTDAEPPPERDVAVALHRAAELERELAGPGRLTEMAARVPRPRNLTYARARGAGLRREARRASRPRRLVVAYSGIDGSGKSTQAQALADTLQRVSIPARPSWARLGFSASGLVASAARLGQRMLPAGSHSAQTARATGETGETGDGRPPLTRRGPVGWSWAMALSLDYVRITRRELRRSRDMVVVLDRALPDALVGLEEGYGGALDLRAQRRIIERFGPRADLVVYLRISGAAAYARKQDLFAREVLEDHARRYDALLPTLPGCLVVDAEQPAQRITLDALRQVAAAAGRPAGPPQNGA